MTRTIYCGRHTLRIPAHWAAFVWRARTYRIVGPTVEVWQRERQAWTPSIRLTTSAPTGRAA